MDKKAGEEVHDLQKKMKQLESNHDVTQEKLLTTTDVMSISKVGS